MVRLRSGSLSWGLGLLLTRIRIGPGASEILHLLLAYKYLFIYTPIAHRDDYSVPRAAPLNLAIP